jgi:hypothetical protein
VSKTSRSARDNEGALVGSWLLRLVPRRSAPWNTAALLCHFEGGKRGMGRPFRPWENCGDTLPGAALALLAPTQAVILRAFSPKNGWVAPALGKPCSAWRMRGRCRCQ